MKIKKSELLKDPKKVAKNLLGATLCSRVGGKLCSGRIVELELYIGECDKACHAWRGKTPRNAVMFGAPGKAYVYFVYGMHNMLNVVISEAGKANAILIRAVEPLDGIETMQARRGIKDAKNLCNGPAKLTKAFGITTKHNGADLSGDLIWLEPATSRFQVATGKRIGVDYAGSDADLPWRFVIKGNKFVSKPI
ncbi:MAG: DNA-3-methyladenine glycosylase [Rickettsiales bacterium]|jgi:DNA-3-methyladenine glycosylase|nr:DNA-3-methyladenine glycosylase [Rickettsiales bacterium]